MREHAACGENSRNLINDPIGIRECAEKGQEIAISKSSGAKCVAFSSGDEITSTEPKKSGIADDDLLGRNASEAELALGPQSQRQTLDTDRSLASVVAAWPKLHDTIRVGILAMISATTSR